MQKKYRPLPIHEHVQYVVLLTNLNIFTTTIPQSPPPPKNFYLTYSRPTTGVDRAFVMYRVFH